MAADNRSRRTRVSVVGAGFEQLEDRCVPSISLVSADPAGGVGDGGSFAPAVSADGRFVAFQSAASDLVPGDTNGDFDIFLRDTRLGTTTRVSVGTGGGQANGDSLGPSISADGRFVAFDSSASNLVPGDTNGTQDVFVRDTWTGVTTRVSVATGGGQGDAGSYSPAISADGRYVAFFSYAGNLVPGDTNGRSDVFVRDTWTGVTTRVSLGSDGAQGDDGSFAPAISADGRFVAFDSFASNLVPGDTNGVRDVFVRDTRAGITTRVSVSSDGTQGDQNSLAPSISWDGRFVAFDTASTNLVAGDTNGTQDVFVRDTRAGTTTRVSVGSDGSQGNGMSFAASISADGRFVAFASFATNLVAGDTNGFADIFVRDLRTGTTTRVSSPRDAQANGNSFAPSISFDGRFVAFDTTATNLVPGDTNGEFDVVLARTRFHPAGPNYHHWWHQHGTPANGHGCG